MSGMIDFVGKTSADALRKSVFTYSNPTPGTGIALNADPTAISATEAAIVIDNSGTVDGGDTEYIIPVSIQLKCTVAGVAATSVSFYFFLDNKNRWASGGTELTAVQNIVDTSSGFANDTPKGKVYIGDITAAAASDARQVGQCKLKTGDAPCFLIGDVFNIFFGPPPGMSGGVDIATATVINRDISVPPVWIGRGSSLVIHPLMPSQSTGVAFEVTITTVERLAKRGF